MTPAEERFKKAVRFVLARGVYPSPGAILRELHDMGYFPQRVNANNLNGREVRWRHELLLELGWKHLGDYNKQRQYIPPQPQDLYR